MVARPSQSRRTTQFWRARDSHRAPPANGCLTVLLRSTPALDLPADHTCSRSWQSAASAWTSALSLTLHRNCIPIENQFQTRHPSLSSVFIASTSTLSSKRSRWAHVQSSHQALVHLLHNSADLFMMLTTSLLSCFVRESSLESSHDASRRSFLSYGNRAHPHLSFPACRYLGARWKRTCTSG